MSEAKELAHKVYELLEKINSSLSEDEMKEYQEELDSLMAGEPEEPDEEKPDDEEGLEQEDYADPDKGIEDEADSNSALAAMLGGGAAGKKPSMSGSDKEDLKRRIRGYFA